MMSSKTEAASMPDSDPMWERRLVTELAREALLEKRRTRRWGIFFKFLIFLYLLTVLLLWLPDDWMAVAKADEKHTALVDLKGIIAPGEPAGADNVVTGLRAAFEDEQTKGVVLRINTPGGSPVQSSYIYREIKRLREKYPDIPLYAVVSDLCASGGYYVAAAADKIYVNESSIVGSIGVLMSSFGAQEALQKLGLERRLMTAGENKAILDPFSDFSEQDREHIQVLLDEMHEQFIATVQEGRGDRLSDDPELFSGLFWTGEESISLGLADAVASAGQVARDIIGAEDIVDFTPEEDVWERLSARLGASAARTFAQISGLTTLPQVQR